MLNHQRETECIQSGRHPLLYELAKSAEWMKEDAFPSAPEYADEHERWLNFAYSKGQWNRLKPRLVKSAFQRDRALSEVGVAYFLDTMCSMPVIEWEPEGSPGKRGEYLVAAGADRIFVEVKTGGWQKDIKVAEGSKSPRFNLPKYINGEARSVSNSGVIRNAVTNGYEQFGDSLPNLLIVRDDYWVDLSELMGPDIALYRSGDGVFTDRKHERLGCLALFSMELGRDGITYRFFLYDNPHALEAVRIPRSAFKEYPRQDGPGRPKRQEA